MFREYESGYVCRTHKSNSRARAGAHAIVRVSLNINDHQTGTVNKHVFDTLRKNNKNWKKRKSAANERYTRRNIVINSTRVMAVVFFARRILLRPLKTST